MLRLLPAAGIKFRPFIATFLSGAALVLFSIKMVAQTAAPVWADTALAEACIREARQLNRQGDHPAALKKAEHVQARAARLLGITPQALNQFLKAKNHQP